LQKEKDFALQWTKNHPSDYSAHHYLLYVLNTELNEQQQQQQQQQQQHQSFEKRICEELERVEEQIRDNPQHESLWSVIDFSLLFLFLPN
jgi:hypothetical protein